MMTRRETLAVHVLKHGVSAALIAFLLAVAIAMAGQVLQRSMAETVSHAQDVSAISFQ